MGTTETKREAEASKKTDGEQIGRIVSVFAIKSDGKLGRDMCVYSILPTERVEFLHGGRARRWASSIWRDSTRKSTLAYRSRVNEAGRYLRGR